jgi:hypothetical protein
MLQLTIIWPNSSTSLTIITMKRENPYLAFGFSFTSDPCLNHKDYTGQENHNFRTHLKQYLQMIPGNKTSNYTFCYF